MSQRPRALAITLPGQEGKKLWDLRSQHSGASKTILNFIQALHLAGIDPLRDLAGSDLSGINLCTASLRGADLRGARLVGCDLSHADLREACLTDCDLRYARLEKADLSRADLAQANLRCANLRNASLVNTNISHAYLEGALLFGAHIEGSSLDSPEANLLAQPDHLFQPGTIRTHFGGEHVEDRNKGYILALVTSSLLHASLKAFIAWNAAIDPSECDSRLFPSPLIALVLHSTKELGLNLSHIRQELFIANRRLKAKMSSFKQTGLSIPTTLIDKRSDIINGIGLLLLLVHDFTEAERYLGISRRYCQQRGLTGPQSLIEAQYAFLALEQLRFSEAASMLLQAHNTCHHMPQFAAVHAASLAALGLLYDDIRGSQAWLRYLEALAIPGERPASRARRRFIAGALAFVTGNKHYAYSLWKETAEQLAHTSRPKDAALAHSLVAAAHYNRRYVL